MSAPHQSHHYERESTIRWRPSNWVAIISILSSFTFAIAFVVALNCRANAIESRVTLLEKNLSDSQKDSADSGKSIVRIEEQLRAVSDRTERIETLLLSSGSRRSYSHSPSINTTITP